MTVVFTALFAIVPSLLLLRYFYKRDLNPEPRRVLLGTFFLGFLVLIPVAVLVLPLWKCAPKGAHPLLGGLYFAFLCAALPEECFKFLVVTRYSARNPAFDEPMDGVVYGAAASLGFATLENILYVSTRGLPVALVRAVTAVPSHACLGAILGYYVARARFSVRRSHAAWMGLLFAILLHGLYDFPLFALQCMKRQGRLDDAAAVLGLLALFLAVLVFEIVWTLRIVRRLRRRQLRAGA